MNDPANLFSDVSKALDFAIEAEMISIEFYELLGHYCTQMEAKTVLVMLEKAERDHLVYVTNLKKNTAPDLRNFPTPQFYTARNTKKTAPGPKPRHCF